MKKVAVIIVTYNRLELLKDCVDSIRKQSYKDFSIIIINNGSTDNTANWLEKQEDIIVINQENLGGAGGFYTGIKYACEQGYQYSWVMDDDVVATPNALFNIMKNEDIIEGFMCSHITDTDNNPCNVPQISNIKSHITGELVWGELLHKNILRVDIASFVSLLFSNTIIYKIGLPYKEYFIWGDDTEFTKRISSIYPSYLVYDSIVIHKRINKGILSIFTENDIRRVHNYFYLFRNRIHMQKELKKSLFWILYSFYNMIILLFKGEFYKSYIVAKAIVSSLYFSPKVKYPQK